MMFNASFFCAESVMKLAFPYPMTLEYFDDHLHGIPESMISWSISTSKQTMLFFVISSIFFPMGAEWK